MNREAFEALRHRAAVACQMKRLVRQLRELGCPPGTTLGDIQARAERDLLRVNAQARPIISSGESLNPRKSQA